MKTCSPLPLLADQQGKVGVSNHTPTLAFGKPWNARVPAKYTNENLEAVKPIPGSFFKAPAKPCSPPQLPEDPFLKEALVPDLAQL